MWLSGIRGGLFMFGGLMVVTSLDPHLSTLQYVGSVIGLLALLCSWILSELLRERMTLLHKPAPRDKDTGANR